MLADNIISVMIVDDNDLVAQSMARCCDVPDIRVVAVVSIAASALEAGRRYKPDVVLMDYRLGGDNGVSVARKLLDIVPTSKVVIVTGAASERVQQDALDVGCVGCVEKTMQLGRMLPDLVRRAHFGRSV
jgi:DNA-binding NarL/FixJ family response regulator